MRVAFLGLGLIGGSIARALRESGARGVPGRLVEQAAAVAAGSPAPVLVSWTPSGRGPAEALAQGVIDEAASTLEDAVVGADVVVLAAPPLDCLHLIDRLAALRGTVLPVDAVVTDVASTKAALVAAADARALPFVGGHPMAGLETTGFGAARADLFRDRPWVIVAGAASREGDVLRVIDLATACGARPVPMTAGDHDRAVAGISHLPLVVAAALVESVAGSGPPAADWPVSSTLAAGGWASTTRLAAGSPEMGAGILATNAEAVRERVADLRRVLERWEGDLADAAAGWTEAEDVAARFETRLRGARDRLRDQGERVLVVPRVDLMGDPGWYGLRTDDLESALDTFRTAARFEPRARMEADPSWKQVIPYLVLRDHDRIFLMRRTRSGGDARLHDRWSIGVGGHLNPGDVDLAGGLLREWREEIDADFVPDFRFVGLLNDDTTDVGRVHVGAVFVAEAEGRPVAVRETDKLSGSFATLDEVLSVAGSMETWSRLLAEAIARGAVR